MSMFDGIEEAVGLDADDPKLRLAEELVAADRDFLESLIALRVDKDLNKTQVAAMLGRHKSTVTNFEQLGADPHLSTIRRYAAAIGARYCHYVEDAEDERRQYSRLDGWTAVVVSRIECGEAQRAIGASAFRWNPTDSMYHVARHAGEWSEQADVVIDSEVGLAER